METIIDLFDIICKTYKNKIACIYKDTSISFEELHNKVNTMANILYHLGIRPKDRVAFMLSKRPEFIITYLAVIKLGAINVPLNYKLTAYELANPILNNIQPKILLCEYELIDKITELNTIINLPEIVVINDGKHNFISYTDLEKKCYKFDLEFKSSPNDIVAIQFTSGTSSFPKGVCWNHYGIMAHVKALRDLYKITDKDNWLCLLPSFLSSHNSVILPIFTGSTSILMENNNPEKILYNIEKYKANIMMCAAVVCIALLKLTRKNKHDTSSLRLVVPGGMRFPQKDLKCFEKIFNTRVMDVLAMTEMGIYLSNNYEHFRYGSVGKPIPGVEVKIVDESGREKSHYSVGEIITHGKSMFTEYYKLSEESNKVIKNKWFYTGDLGWKDNDGFFYHVSRKSEMINVGGLKIFPQEIEETLLKNNKIDEVAVTVARDEIRGEIPKVLIVLKKGTASSKTEIIRFCKNKIANYKIPKIVKFCKSLPKTGSGKIYRKALFEW